MNALLFVQDLLCTFQQVDTPTAAQGESLVQVEAAGICGSDMHAWHGHDPRRRPPLILGHEVCGTVIEGPLQGQRVTMNPRITCGQCEYCLSQRDNLCTHFNMIGMTHGGGFAEYITIPDHCLVPVGNLPAVIGALTEPTAVCLHGINLLKRLQGINLTQADLTQTLLAKHNILIIGGGAIGILTAILLQHYGAKNITISETNPLRLQSSAHLAQTINPIEHPIPTQHYDCVFDAVGLAATRSQAIQSVKNGGSIIHLGLQEATGDMDARRMTLGEITFIGAFTYTMQEIEQSVTLLQKLYTLGHLKQEIWVDTMPLDAGQSGFESIHNGSTHAAKIVLCS